MSEPTTNDRLRVLETRMDNISKDQRTCCPHLWYQAGAIGPAPTYSVGGFSVCKKCWEAALQAEKEIQESLRGVKEYVHTHTNDGCGSIGCADITHHLKHRIRCTTCDSEVLL